MQKGHQSNFVVNNAYKGYAYNAYTLNALCV